MKAQVIHLRFLLSRNAPLAYTVINHMIIKGEILMTIQSRPLSTLTVGEMGIIRTVLEDGDLSGRLADIGCVAGGIVKMLGKAPFGTLTAFEIMDSVFALRKNAADRILVIPTTGGDTP